MKCGRAQSGIVKNPGGLERGQRDIDQNRPLWESTATLEEQRQKLRHGKERLIDSLAEGVMIETNSQLV